MGTKPTEGESVPRGGLKCGVGATKRQEGVVRRSGQGLSVARGCERQLEMCAGGLRCEAPREDLPPKKCAMFCEGSDGFGLLHFEMREGNGLC